MLSTWIQSKKDEEGFTLIELLVVVIIIGILAAIAIPVFLNQRENAWRSSVESDLRNAAIAMETLYTRDGSYVEANGETVTEATSPVTVEGVQFRASEGVTLEITATAVDFQIEGTHANLTAAGTEDTLEYDSTSGGLAGADWTK